MKWAIHYRCERNFARVAVIEALDEEQALDIFRVRHRGRKATKVERLRS